MKLRKIAAAVGAVGLLSIGSVANANTDPTVEQGKNVVCSVQDTYTSTSILKPGASDVTSREKDRPVSEDGTELVDVAIDGWSGIKSGTADEHKVRNEEGVVIGVDGWAYSNAPNFRVVFGTRIDLHQIDGVKVEFTHPDEALTIKSASATTPAGGATPADLKGTVDGLVEPTFEGAAVSWDVNTSRSMKPGTSAHLSVPLNPLTTNSPEPITAKMTVTVTRFVPCADENGDNYTDIAEGGAGQCVVDWKLGSTTDRRLLDYSNNGYRYKVGHDEKGRALYGYGSVQHWVTPNDKDLIYRILLANTDALKEGTTIQLETSGNWTISSMNELDQSATDYFHRFDGPEGFDNVVTGASFDAAKGTITLPAMPAGSNIILMVVGQPTSGGPVLRTEGYALDATVKGDYTDEAYLSRGCAGDKPEAEVVTGDWEEVTRVCVEGEDGKAEVTSKRTVTTTDYLWDLEGRAWVKGEPVTETETMTEIVDDETCAVAPEEPVTPGEPTDEPSTPRTEPTDEPSTPRTEPTQPKPGKLPATGADVTTIGASALGLLALGGAAFIFARRRAN